MFYGYAASACRPVFVCGEKVSSTTKLVCDGPTDMFKRNSTYIPGRERADDTDMFTSWCVHVVGIL